MNELILFKGLFDNDLNIPQLDNQPCKVCKKIPETEEYMARTLKGTLIRRIDRTARVDCDASVGNEPPRLETYHKACWIEEVFND
jgi:hypothetical protein